MRRPNEQIFNILKKGEEYIAIFESDSSNFILDDLENQGYVYLDRIRSKDSTTAIKRWCYSQDERVAYLEQKNRELQEVVKVLEQSIDDLEHAISDLENEFKVKGQSMKAENVDELSIYTILGVPNRCKDTQLIKKNYQKLSSIYHADKVGGNASYSDEMMKIINNAYKQVSKK